MIASGILYSIFAILTCISSVSATITNPADPRIYQPLKHNPRDAVSGHLYCYRCERHVLESSKHCTVCQKCIDVFDHHCIWLNNCVGKHNYIQFLGLLVSAALMLCIQIAIGIAILVQYAQDIGVLDNHIQIYYPNLSGTAYFIITIIISILAVIGVGAILQLLIFHISLIYHNMTTYEFIMSRVQGWREASSPTSPNNTRNHRGNGSAYSAAMIELRNKWNAKGTTDSSTTTPKTEIELSKSNNTTKSDSDFSKSASATATAAATGIVEPLSGSSTYYEKTVTVPTEVPATASVSEENKQHISHPSSMDQRSIRVATVGSPRSGNLYANNNIYEGTTNSLSPSRSSSPVAYPTAMDVVRQMNSTRTSASPVPKSPLLSSESPIPVSVPPSPVLSPVKLTFSDNDGPEKPQQRPSDASTPNISYSEGGPSENEDDHNINNTVKTNRIVRSSMIGLEEVSTTNTPILSTIAGISTVIDITENDNKRTHTEHKDNTEHKLTEDLDQPTIIPIKATEVNSSTSNDNTVPVEEVNSSILCSPASETPWEPSPLPRGTRIVPVLVEENTVKEERKEIDSPETKDSESKSE